MAALTYAAFLENLKAEFRVKNEGSDSILELVEVSERKRSPGHEQFSIVFRGANEAAFGQGMFRLEHPAMGTIDLFMVPINADSEGIYYEAVFNRLPEDQDGLSP